MKKIILFLIFLLMASPCWARTQQGIVGVVASGADVTAPTVSTATIGTNGTTLTLGMSETVTRSGGTFDVDCTTAGQNITATYSSGSGSSSLVYTLGTTVNSGDTCNLDYDGAANGIEDGAGNDLAAITNGSVTNSSTQTSGTYYYPSGKTASSFTSNKSDHPYTFGSLIGAAAGTAVALGMKIDDGGSAVGVKMCLKSSSNGATLASCSGTSQGSAGAYWFECTISYSTSATNYYVMGQMNTTGAYYYDTTGGGDGFYLPETYAACCSDTAPSSDTDHNSARMKIQ